MRFLIVGRQESPYPLVGCVEESEGGDCDHESVHEESGYGGGRKRDGGRRKHEESVSEKESRHEEKTREEGKRRERQCEESLHDEDWA